MFLVRYQLLISIVVAWALAQILKAILYFIDKKELRIERLIGNGGMPSSHSAAVCSLTTSCLLKYGNDSYEFAMAFVFSMVVIVDAMGVRLETGKQAELLNLIIGKNIFNMKDIAPEKRFKELIGHTPLQVFVGGIIGIGTALVISAYV